MLLFCFYVLLLVCVKNLNKLTFSAGVHEPNQTTDSVENLWCTYYKAIFNPARIKLNAMYNEMPRRYWPTLPETKLIPEMLQAAPERVTQMMQYTEGLTQSARDYFPKIETIDMLSQAMKNCRACPLYHCDNHAVFIKGNIVNSLMIIGDQLGLEENTQGKLFSSDARQLLEEILHEIPFETNTIHITSVVKHSNYTVLNNKKIPNIREVNACKPWVEKEIEIIKPKLVLCLGNTAARAFIKPGYSVTKSDQVWLHKENYLISAAIHPLAILRTKDKDQKQQLRMELKNALLKAIQL